MRFDSGTLQKSTEPCVTLQSVPDAGSFLTTAVAPKSSQGLEGLIPAPRCTSVLLGLGT